MNLLLNSPAFLFITTSFFFSFLLSDSIFRYMRKNQRRSRIFSSKIRRIWKLHLPKRKETLRQSRQPVPMLQDLMLLALQKTNKRVIATRAGWCNKLKTLTSVKSNPSCPIRNNSRGNHNCKIGLSKARSYFNLSRWLFVCISVVFAFDFSIQTLKKE